MNNFFRWVMENALWIAIAILILWLLLKLTKKKGDGDGAMGGEVA